MAASESYQHVSEPRSVAPNRAGKYRDENEPSNIMYDPRVVRGNTYAAQVLTSTAQEEAARMRDAERASHKARVEREQWGAGRHAPSTPPPAGGRKHIDVQTDNYLEELADKAPEVEEETQTEAFLDRPPSPLFMPAKTGQDMATQIEGGDLFDFDAEVVPILEVLVGKTLETGMRELMEEEELAAIRLQQENFEQTRNAELAEVQRLEAEAKRRFAEKQRRKKEQAERKAQEAELKQKVAARSFTKNYLADMHASVFGQLMESGHFFDPLEKEVTEDFLPWLMDEVVTNLDQTVEARALADGVLSEVLQLAASRTQEAAERRAQEEAQAEQARLEAEAAAAEAAEDGEGEEGDDE